MSRGTRHDHQGGTEYDYYDPPKLDHYVPRLMISGTEIASYGTNPTKDGDYEFDGCKCSVDIMIRLGAGASFGGLTGNWSVSLPMPMNLNLGNKLARISGHGTIGIAPAWPASHENTGKTAHFPVRLHGGRYEDLTDVNAAYLIGTEPQAFGAGLQHNSPNPFLIQASAAAGYYVCKTPIAEAEWKDFHLHIDYPVLGTY